MNRPFNSNHFSGRIGAKKKCCAAVIDPYWPEFKLKTNRKQTVHISFVSRMKSALIVWYSKNKEQKKGNWMYGLIPLLSFGLWSMLCFAEWINGTYFKSKLADKLLPRSVSDAGRSLSVVVVIVVVVNANEPYPTVQYLRDAAVTSKPFTYVIFSTNNIYIHFINKQF